MSDDIVQRLRDACPATQDFTHTTQGALMDEAADHIEQLTAERDKYESAWMTAEGKLADVEAERDRLRETLGKLECKCSSNCDWERDDVCPSWIARAALKGEKP